MENWNENVINNILTVFKNNKDLLSRYVLELLPDYQFIEILSVLYSIEYIDFDCLGREERFSISIFHDEFIEEFKRYILYKIGGEDQKMIIKRLLDKILSDNKVKITFIKKDGTIREMVCTKDTFLLRENQKYKEWLESIKNKDSNLIKKEKSYDDILVWDLEKNGWRRIKIERIQKIEIIDV